MRYCYTTADVMTYSLLKDYAKENRKNTTDAEHVLWQYLRNRQLGEPFRRQHIIGEFIADFVCLPAMLIIEVDGKYHQLPEQKISDEQRTNWLNKQGFSVLRFTNEEVLGDTEQVIKRIKENITQ